MKTNFSNFIKIIMLIILIFLIMYLVFYIVTKNEATVYKNNNEITTDTNIYLIEKELTTIFAYINEVKSDDTNSACSLLSKKNGYDINSGNNFFDYYGPIILDCLENKNYLSYNNYVLMNENEIEEYYQKFLEVEELTKINEIFDTYMIAGENNLLQEYINQNYQIGYEILNTVNNDINYSIKRIFKMDDNVYEVKILANDKNNNISYNGNLKVLVDNEEIQYSELIFY